MPLSVWGWGEAGIQHLAEILVGLVPFAPSPATFDQGAFNAVVAFDSENQCPLPTERAQVWFDVALDCGFIAKDQTNPARVTVDKNLQDAVIRVYPDEE